MISWVFFLISSRFSSKSDLEDGQISLISNSHESFLSGLININNLSLGYVDDLVKAFNLSPDDLCDPECSIHESFSCLNGHKTLAFTEEKSESSGDVFAYVRDVIP
jgi:hypothetical protein